MAVSISPLVWGQGPKLFEIFIEPTCPFCARALLKLMPLLETVGPDQMTLQVHLYSQPWHLWSPVVIRAVTAAQLGTGGREQAWKALLAIGAHRTEFVMEEHCSGPNMNETPAGILGRIEKLAGLELAEAFRSLLVTQEIKRQARYGRQNGIHVTPTFMVNGLIDDRFSSGQSVEEWKELLG
ncbi:thioredoxin [Oecophyllibacter saccharovorans]|uniref:DsbA family protein n=1 Tax=Oecophyllibacter saccharovorans TaxID=2558360 RepID=UPI00114485EB|nr:thioredoxin domain-containing protein [Oecophyllibacter saccharovorans]QDH14702.1 thioredoxin [Oecophyllibacter saccharovorans]